ncbi:hypothetical protein PROFUN_02521 [Planoprotostelium fungivorum]|uniref:NAD(P)-binding domain-containing protein n=1 Tax=Planoprotostelium fungivorum TaxID=1890364 RepID=A0A2P6MPA1_9EUKA|nr:hypothetical protein PROFUN_02521 [Planoprotostelium fungivorum]
MSIQKVAIAGASGNIGSPILQQLLAAKDFTVFVLIRKETKKTDYEGVQTLQVDFQQPASLVEALKSNEIQAVVSAIQAALIKTTSSTHQPTPESNSSSSIIIFGKKKLASERATANGLKYVSLYTSAFLDWGLSNGELGIDFRNKKATIFDTGDEKLSATTLAGVGKAVVGVLRNPTRITTEPLRNQLLEEYKRQTGEEGYTVRHVDLEQHRLGGLKLLKEGNRMGGLFLIQATLWSGTTAGYWGENNDNEKVGLQQIPILCNPSDWLSMRETTSNSRANANVVLKEELPASPETRNATRGIVVT